MKRNLPLTLPVEGSIYPFEIDGRCELHAVDRIDLGQGIMYLRPLASPHNERPTFINDVVRMVRPNDAAAWLPTMSKHYSMGDEGRAALIAEAKENPYSSVGKNQQWLAAFAAESGPHTPMGPMCHNGEDLARAFPQVPNDLSRDIYATIGDPVPALVWPRQESGQDPTHSETPDHIVMTRAEGEPGMPHVMRVEDFTVGDRVTVGKKVETLSDGRDAGWDSKWMDETVGQQGRVNDAVGTRVLVQLDDGCEYAYAPEALAPESACSEVPAEPADVTPVRPHMFKTGNRVKVARAVMRDSTGHWCFWTAQMNATIGCVGEVAVVTEQTGATIRVDFEDEDAFYYSPEALEHAGETGE